ncbi:protein eyes shut [Cloeon dipterum]|uniref:protein eyes shut n=1 Tax=Cloeon dipterum TaxID=197152 RepID=UPI00321F9DC5
MEISVKNMRRCVQTSKKGQNEGQKLLSRTHTTIALFFILSFSVYISETGIACLSNPCVYGLCVDDVNSSYSCYCADGYTGSNCQTEWDECWSQPCLNGGDCFDLVANFNCSCPEGFSGLSCEIDRDECLSEPCQNNGTCVDGSNGFECHCLPGYTGSVCEWDISVCNETGTERCLNGGACVEGKGERFWCICAPGWGGAICEDALDPCLILQPCQHGGLCLPRGSEFICACPFGFTGEMCEFELALCKENPCLNGAICTEEAGASICYCVPDFHGDLCQFQYDECLLPPTPSCKNGGTCIDGVDGFSCSCPPDVTGKFCECPIGQDCTNHSYFPELSSSTYGSPTTALHRITGSTEKSLFTLSHWKTPSTTTQSISDESDSPAGETIKLSSTQSSISDSTDVIAAVTVASMPTDLSPIFSQPSSVSEDSSDWIEVTDSPNFLSSSTVSELQYITPDKEFLLNITKPAEESSLTSNLEFITTTGVFSTAGGEISAKSGLWTMSDSFSSTFSLQESSLSHSTYQSYIGVEGRETNQPVSEYDLTTSGSTISTVFNQYSTYSTTEMTEDPSETQKSESTTESGLSVVSSEATGEISSTDIVYSSTHASITDIAQSESAQIPISSLPSFDHKMSSVLSSRSEASTDGLQTTASFQESKISSLTSQGATEKTTTDEEIYEYTKSTEQQPQTSPAWASATNSTEGGILDGRETAPFTTTTDEIPDYGLPTSDYGETTAETQPKNCKDESPCQNGGVCFSLESNIVCRCPFQFTGVFCEVPTNYSEVSLLPTSWLLFRVASPIKRNETLEFTHNLEATFRIVSEEGVVFTLADADDGPTSSYFMQMSIYHGRLQLQFSCGLQSVKFSESKQRVDTGKPTRISASLKMWILQNTTSIGRCRAELKLNNTLAVSGEQTKPFLNLRKDVALAHLVFGSWPRTEAPKYPEQEDDFYSERISTSPGVVACLSHVKVNERYRVLLADVTAGSNDVSECVQLACLSNPCFHGGTCEETPSNSWSCRCLSGRLGPRCEASVCENNPCHAGGTCLVHPGTNFVCLCPIGRGGIFCEKEHIINEPCFFPTFVDISPYMAVPLLPKHESFKQAVELSIRFVPARTHQVALLVYIGHGPKDHIALGYVHGRIILTWDLGSGPRRIFTTTDFSSGTVHEVRFGRNGKEGWLKIKGDNTTYTGQSIGRMVQLNTRPVAYFGGFDDINASILPHDLPKHSGFEGCLSHLEVKSAQSQPTRYFPPGPPNSPAKGRSVVQKDYNPCTNNPCRQGGICLPHGPSFACLCAQGWFGPLCAEPRNPCDTQRHMCAEGSTCVPLQFGYECDCPLGKTGRWCNSMESRNSVVWPELYFSGKRSFLEVPRSLPLHSDLGLLEHSCVEFEMKPQTWPGAPAAQVLFFSQDSDTGDFMALLLTSDRVLELILGSGDGPPMILSSPRGVSVRAGVWIKVRAGRVGRRVFLSVAGRSVSSWLLPGQSSNWNGGQSTLYIGGAPDLSSVAPVTWLLLRPFGGCIRKLHVDWRKVIVHLGRARLNNRGVRTVGKHPPRFRYDVAQLSPEYIKQLSNSNIYPKFGDDILSLLKGEIRASYMAGSWDSSMEPTQKKTFHSDGKASWPMNLRRVTNLKIYALISNNTKNTEELNEVESSTPEVEASTLPTGLMARNLRTRDALFALSARNVKPCEKSALALLQLDPCVDGQIELDCLSLPLKELPENYRTPEFRGDGWISFQAPLLLMDNTEVSPVRYLNLKFSAKSNEGLVVWIQEDADNKAYVGLGIQEGRLRVVWGNELNTSNTAVISGKINDGNFHRVNILWDSAEKAMVWLDGEMEDLESEWKRQKRHFSDQIKSTLNIVIGGTPEESPAAQSVSHFFSSSYQGCVAELGWNDETAQLSDFPSYQHKNVYSCNAK